MEKFPKLLAIFIAFIIIGSGIVIKPVEGEEKFQTNGGTSLSPPYDVHIEKPETFGFALPPPIIRQWGNSYAGIVGAKIQTQGPIFQYIRNQQVVWLSKKFQCKSTDEYEIAFYYRHYGRYGYLDTAGLFLGYGFIGFKTEWVKEGGKLVPKIVTKFSVNYDDLVSEGFLEIVSWLGSGVASAVFFNISDDDGDIIWKDAKIAHLQGAFPFIDCRNFHFDSGGMVFKTRIHLEKGKTYTFGAGIV
ncbi:MAG: hypothetical protein J7L80_04900, partial [Thermoplasmata archaeon]|nr:hypothetical protein [Thermoplasmata archaeon]